MANDPLQLPPLRLMSDSEMQSIRKRLIDCGGNLEKAGISMLEMRNAIYTKTYQSKPLSPSADKKPAEPKIPSKKITIDDILE